MSTPCQRFETEALERLERGEPLDPHFDTCPACLAARTDYAKILGALAARTDTAQPPGDFEAKVWARIRREERRRWAFRVVPAFAGGVAAAALVLTVALPRSADPSLELTVRPGAVNAVRGTTARPGDVLVLKGDAAGAAHAELRLYRDGVLFYRCDESGPCTRRGGTLRDEVTLDDLGRYEAVLLLSEDAIPAPEGERGRLNPDIDAAVAAGARVITTGSVEVF